MVKKQWMIYFLACLRGFPDFTVEIVKTHHSDDAVILEIRMKGIHRREWTGLKPSGKLMNLPAACIFDFDQDRQIGEKVYFDMATLVRQVSS